MPQTTSTQCFFNMPYSSVNSYHTGLGVRTFGTDTITRQAKPSWVSTKTDYPSSQQVTLGASGGVPTRNTASTSQGNGQSTSNEPTWNTANTFEFPTIRN